MNLHTLKPNTERKKAKRVGRGGKRGTYSGKGTKGQKSRAGSSVRPGFRGGDNRLWQLFPKQRGASGRRASAHPHSNQISYVKMPVVNLDIFNQFKDGQRVNPALLVEQGIIMNRQKKVKILANGELKKKIEFEGFSFSATAKEKIIKAGGVII